MKSLLEPISRIDSKVNQLYFRGYNAVDLASTRDFETVLFLLVNGSLPTETQKENLIHSMVKHRELFTDNTLTLEDLIGQIDVFREQRNLDLYDTLLAFVTLCPMVIANEFTRSQQNEMSKSDKRLGHAANFLWMVRGTKRIEDDIHDFQTALILHMDDPDNPSLSALKSTLDKGKELDALHAALRIHVDPLHHGAGTLAMEMFKEIKRPENVKEFLEARLESGEKIYGLGHRIYKGIDPRAVVLRRMLKDRVKGTDDEWILHVSDSVAMEGKKLLSKHKGIDAYPNIDLYNAAFYYSLGFPSEMNTSLFAISRAAGWMAHILDLS